jgi:radical SAM superfamily enzyme YgiQ (UPF0313 family)
MKVWLINPRTEGMITTEVPGYVSKEVGRFPPLGLLYLAATVRRHRPDDVRVIDMPAAEVSYPELARQLAAETPQVAGITGTTHNLVEILRAAETVKAASPGTLVCLGGPHVDAFPREAAALPAIDVVVRGEGERPFLALLERLAQGRAWTDIPGLGYRQAGQVAAPQPAEAVEELDGLPFPARELVQPRHYYYVLGQRATFVTLLSSRGCPYRCIFCSTPHGKYRVRAPAHIAEEIAACRTSGGEEFHFVDDTFNALPGRIEAVSAELLRRGLRIRWSFRGRVDHVSESELRLARRAGCVRMHLGIETGTDAGLRLLRKGITTDQVERAIAWARNCGIATAAYFLIGCPHEKTRADVMQTIEFACRVNPDFALFNILTLYPDTELFAMAVERGLVRPDFWAEFVRQPRSDFQLRFWEESFSPEELADLLRLAYRRFYLRPALIWRTLRSLGSIAELRHKAAAGLAILCSRTRRKTGRSAR